MAFVLAIVIGAVAELLVIGGAIAAYFDRFFLVSQMKARGVFQGFPFVIHGGMWSDFFIISPLIAFLTYSYADKWQTFEWAFAGMLALTISLLLHFFVYLKGGLPGSHGYEGKTTVAGWLHIIYTALALAVLILFYFYTSSISRQVLVITSVVLAVHPLTPLLSQALANKYHPEWFPENPLKTPGIWLALIFIWIFIIWKGMQFW